MPLLLRLLLLFSFLSSPLLASDLHDIEGEAQGTTYHITYRGALQKDLATEVTRLLKDFDRVFSNYRPDSSISKFNAATSTDWQKIEPELAQLLSEAVEISAQTSGAFDVTIGAVLKVWGFGPYHKAKSSVPSDKAIQEALKHVGYSKLEVRLNPPAAKKSDAGLLIDLSGIAQGASVDRLAELFDRRGLKDYLIEVGGELITKGEKAPGKPWILAIESPTDSSGSISQTVQTKGLALSTSGDYRKFFEEKGKRYSHIFDPRQGRPIETTVASASILSKTCRHADAYAKAFMILKREEALALAKKLSLSAYLISHKGAGFSSEYMGDFESYLVRY